MRFRLFIRLCLYAGMAEAFWTGVAMEFGDYDLDWKFDEDTREAQITSVDFQVEDSTEDGVRIGLGLGYFDMRLVADSAAETLKFDGNYLSIYLRKPFEITDNIALHGLFDLRYWSGNESGSGDDRADIDWTESRVQVGLSFSFAKIRITPYAEYRNVDGDVSDDRGTGVFDMDEPQYSGLQFDYFVQQDAYVRLELRDGGQGGFLTFARRY